MHSVGFNKPAAGPNDKKLFCDDEIVTVSVSGKRFQTQIGNLRKYPDSKLASMFPEAPMSIPDSGEFHIDR